MEIIIPDVPALKGQGWMGSFSHYYQLFSNFHSQVRYKAGMTQLEMIQNTLKYFFPIYRADELCSYIQKVIDASHSYDLCGSFTSIMKITHNNSV